MVARGPGQPGAEIQTNDSLGSDVRISRHSADLRYCPDMSTARQQTWQVATPQDFGRALAGIRGARGLTQEELAEVLGVSRSYLAAIEAGHSVQMLDRLLRALRRMGAEITVALPPDRDDAG